MALSVGTRLGPYEVLAPLGAGGMGEVYRARDTRLGREVAVKVLPAAFSADRDRLRRFEQEARAASALNHPNILTIHDIGTHEGSPYVVSELLEGGTLRERLGDGALAARKAIDYGIQIANGLAAAHEKGIVHRDLKPENLFITKDARAKILDFGLAKLTHPETIAGPLTEVPTVTAGTEPGVVMGTVGYMSPEQVRGQPTDHRSDIFAFGSILYEMLSGQRAFRRDSAIETMSAILKEEPAELSQSVTGVPPSLERIVRRCLEKNPEERFQSARDLAFALEAVSAVSGEPAATLARGGPRRRSWWALRLTAGAVLLLILAADHWWRQRQTQIALRRAVPPAEAKPAAQLAILPLRVLTPGEEIDYLSVGIPDAIITRLANVRQLRLRPTTAILRYEKEVVDPQRVGQQLEVEYVLVGTLQRPGNVYRVSVQLVRTSDGVPLWGENYDLSKKELLSLQDAVAEQVAKALQIQMTSVEAERVYRRYTQNASAYELYLQGRALLSKLTEVDMRAAIERFEAALRMDPNYALARAGLATALAFFATRYAYEPEANQWGKRAEEEARKALEQAPELAEAHVALGNAAGTVYRNFDWPQMIAEAEEALALNPSLALAHLALARAFYHLGLFERCRAEIEKAHEISGESLPEAERISVNAALFDGRFEEARKRAESLLARTDAPAPRMMLGLTAYYLGEPSRAKEILAAVRRSGGKPDIRSRAVFASVLAATGERQTAAEIIRSVEQGAYMDHHVAYSMGAASAQLGRVEEALRWLRHAAATGFPCYPWLAKDPLLEPLRPDPRFQGFLAELRQSYEAARSRYGTKTARQPGPPSRS